MCGIAGILRSREAPPDPGEIQAMTSALAHRGPDGADVLIQGQVALGHTRLAIIDLSPAASQPMRSRDGRLALTFNGEICNYLELRRELADAGCEFRTGSDTEVILQAYAVWGDSCVHRFNGMFAFCLADHGRRRLFLARDHAGIKPLYYWRGKGFFAFASTLNSLRQVAAPAPAGNLQSVDFFLRYQYIPSPHTIYHGVFKLPPAHTLNVSFDGPLDKPERYWRLRFAPAPESQRDDLRARVHQGIKDAVQRWLVADVPVGIFLSGGIDSTCVASAARRLSGKAMQAFSIGFDEAGYSEIDYAGAAARRLGLDFSGEVIKSSTLEILPDLLAHYGEPFGDASAIPTWHVAKLARGQVKTVLSGDGGDEGFGGYETFFHWVKNGKWAAARRREWYLDLKAGRFRNMAAFLDGLGYGPEAWSRFIYYTFYPQRQRLWRPEYVNLIDTPAGLFWETHRQARHYPGMSYPQAMDFGTYLPGAVLTKVDTASMYHGLEVRPALLDKELLETAARLPETLKYAGGKTGKLVLQDFLRDEFPPDFIKRPKQGFGIPRCRWLSPGSLGWEMLGDLLLTRRSLLYDWFNEAEVKRHVLMQSQGLDNSQHVWLLLVLALWREANSKIIFR